MKATLLSYAIILTKAHSTASEVFLIFTTQLYQYLRYLVIPTLILPNSNTSGCSLSVSSK